MRITAKEYDRLHKGLRGAQTAVDELVSAVKQTRPANWAVADKGLVALARARALCTSTLAQRRKRMD